MNQEVGNCALDMEASRYLLDEMKMEIKDQSTTPPNHCMGQASLTIIGVTV